MRSASILPSKDSPVNHPDLQRIRRALIDLCAERGYVDLEISDVCARAGVEISEFLDEFADLEDAFCYTYEYERDRILATYDEATAGMTVWRDRVRTIAYVLYRTLKNDPALAKLMAIEVQTAGARAQRLQWEGVAPMFVLLDEGRAEMEPGAKLSIATAETTAGGIFQALVRAISSGEFPPEEDVVPEGMYVAMLPYLGPEVASEELKIPPPPHSG